MSERYFFIDECSPKKFILRISFEKLGHMYTKGSYGVLAARVMNLSYANYLRMCRDIYGADLKGKNCKYVVPYYSNPATAMPLIDELNRRMSIIMEKRNGAL